MFTAHRRNCAPCGLFRRDRTWNSTEFQGPLLPGFSPEIARRIEAASKGEVSAAELLGISQSAAQPGMREEPAHFSLAALDEAFLDEAATYGLDAAEIARSAVERAVKAERMKRFSEDNREAIESWNDLVEREGLWSDGLRAF